MWLWTWDGNQTFNRLRERLWCRLYNRQPISCSSAQSLSAAPVFFSPDSQLIKLLFVTKSVCGNKYWKSSHQIFGQIHNFVKRLRTRTLSGFVEKLLNSDQMNLTASVTIFIQLVFGVTLWTSLTLRQNLKAAVKNQDLIQQKHTRSPSQNQSLLVKISAAENGFRSPAAEFIPAVGANNDEVEPKVWEPRIKSNCVFEKVLIFVTFQTIIRDTLWEKMWYLDKKSVSILTSVFFRIKSWYFMMKLFF